MKPLIAYDNLLELGTVVASSEQSGYEAANCYDGNTFDAWMPDDGEATLTVYLTESKAVDFLAVAVHDLGTRAATLKLQYSTDGGSTWTDHLTLSPTDDGPKMATGDAVSSDLWRVWIDNTPACYIGVLSFGEYLECERGARPGFVAPRFGRTPVFLDNDSEGGQFLGRSVIRQGAQSTLTLESCTAAWVRSSLVPFLDYAQGGLFFLGWDVGTYPNEIAVCRLSEPPQLPLTGAFYLDCSLPLRCLVGPVTTRQSIAALPPPATVTATTDVSTAGAIDVAWDAVTGATGYTLEKSSDDSTWEEVATGIATTEYNVTGLGNSATVYFRVRSENSVGTGPASVSANATTLSSVPDAPVLLTAVGGTNKVDLTWEAVANVAYYETVTPTVRTIGTGTSASVTGLSGNYGGSWVIRARNGLGASVNSNAVSAYTLPGQPAGLAASLSGGTITLTWTAPAGGADGYRVLRSDDGGAFVEIDTTATAGYADAPGSSGTYEYYVVAYNTTGDGPASSTVSETIP